VDLAEQQALRDGAALGDREPGGERQEQQYQERKQRSSRSSALV